MDPAFLSIYNIMKCLKQFELNFEFAQNSYMGDRLAISQDIQGKQICSGPNRRQKHQLPPICIIIIKLAMAMECKDNLSSVEDHPCIFKVEISCTVLKGQVVNCFTVNHSCCVLKLGQANSILSKQCTHTLGAHTLGARPSKDDSGCHQPEIGTNTVLSNFGTHIKF